MPRRLSGAVGGAPERFVPAEMRGDLIDAEHIARYRWAAQLTSGLKVLDAGCGTAYGTSLLANAGAESVVGIDVAADVVAAVEPEMPPNVDLVGGDVEALPFEDDSFDAVVSFEVLEHLSDQPRAVGEFARVLSRGGFLVVSSPNRTVYPPGNPHHRHEFLPEELRLLLRQHFEDVDLYRQHAWLASAVLNDMEYVADEMELDPAFIQKRAPAELGTELYTLAVAGTRPLPSARPAIAMSARPGSPVTVETAVLKRAGADVDGNGSQISYVQELEGHAAALRERVGELEARIRDANDQLRRRDEELRRLYDEAAPNGELREQLDTVHEALRACQDDNRALNDAMAAVHGTRAWQLATVYWSVRDRVRRATRRRPGG